MNPKHTDNIMELAHATFLHFEDSRRVVALRK